MRRPAACVFVVIVLVAAALRFPALDTRPMHADEAVHAAKFARLLEQGRYEYDPNEYHGPTLPYLTLVPAHLRGATRLADLDESTLRSVPAVMGVLLVAFHLLLVPVVGWRAAAMAALLAAVSPAMVYYSRYYIQETLLVCFSLAALASICRYLQTAGLRWALAAGVSLGLMSATKETWVIAFASMGGALLVSCGIWRRETAPVAARANGRLAAAHLGAAALAGGAVFALFFSSFFSHPRGIVDALAAYGTYVERGSGASWHVHPWHYYLGLLAWSGGSPGAPAWTEAAVLGLAAVGIIAVLAGRTSPVGDRRVPLLLAVYSVLMAVAYAAIPYKTPWCALGFLDGFVVMAGIGASRLLAAVARPLPRSLVAACLVAATIHLGWLAWMGSVRYASDPRNPWVYAHTGPGVQDIARQVDVLARAHPDGVKMTIEVISGQNLWPLPWYLRRFPNVRWEMAPVNDGVHAPLILTTPEMEDAVATKLYEWRRPGERELYVPIFDAAVALRPGIEVRGYAAKSVWDLAVVR